jgi:signal recognition particle subunit SRP54
MGANANDKLKRTEAIIYSMTAKERANPNIIDGSRRLRIAKGSGLPVQEINLLLKNFKQMKVMMKKMQNTRFDLTSFFGR